MVIVVARIKDVNAAGSLHIYRDIGSCAMHDVEDYQKNPQSYRAWVGVVHI